MMSLQEIFSPELEEILQLINTKYISIDSAERIRNNNILIDILGRLETTMLKLDPLFEKLFEHRYFGGSFYSGLKLEKPDEFDIDLVLVLPKQCDTCGQKNCGCVKITADQSHLGWLEFMIKKGFYKPLDKFISDDCLQTNKILDWLKGLLRRSLNAIGENDNVQFTESGPALTLVLDGGRIHVDLVPSFKFGSAEWPREFRPNPFASTINPNLLEFFLVPKAAPPNLYHLWRPSFQGQENELIKGRGKLKPALKLLKKMRMSMIRPQISSYYLKTIALKKVHDIQPNFTLTRAFLLCLAEYQCHLCEENISYYWFPKANLLEYVKPSVRAEHCNELTDKIRKLKYHYQDNPLIIAEIILNKLEYKEFLKDPKVSKYLPSNYQGDNPNSESLWQSNEDQSQSTSGYSTGLILGLTALGVGAIAGGIAYAMRGRQEDRDRNRDNDNNNPQQRNN